MPPRLIAEQWATFRERVIPAEASVLQVQECRRSFYAGAEALMRGILKSLDPGTEPTDADMARMDAIEAELHEFAVDVKEGRA